MEISENQMETKLYNNSTAKNFCKIVKIGYTHFN